MELQSIFSNFDNFNYEILNSIFSNEIRYKIIKKLIKDKIIINLSELAKEFNVSYRQIEYNINILSSKGIINKLKIRDSNSFKIYLTLKED